MTMQDSDHLLHFSENGHMTCVHIDAWLTNEQLEDLKIPISKHWCSANYRGYVATFHIWKDKLYFAYSHDWNIVEYPIGSGRFITKHDLISHSRIVDNHVLTKEEIDKHIHSWHSPIFIGCTTIIAGFYDVPYNPNIPDELRITSSPIPSNANIDRHFVEITIEDGVLKQFSDDSIKAMSRICV